MIKALSFGIGATFSIVLCAIFRIPIINSVASIACCAGGSIIAYYIIKLIRGNK